MKIQKLRYHSLNKLNSSDALEFLKQNNIRELLLNVLIQSSKNALSAILDGTITDKDERLFIFENVSIDQIFKFADNNILLPDERQLLFARSLGSPYDAIRFLLMVPDLTPNEITQLVKTIILDPVNAFHIYSNQLIDKLDSKNRKLVRGCLKDSTLAISYLELNFDFKEEKEEAINTLLKTGSNCLTLITLFNHLLSPEQHKQAMIKIASTKTVLQKLISDKLYINKQHIRLNSTETNQTQNSYSLNLLDKKIIVETAMNSNKIDICAFIYENINLPNQLKEKLEPLVLLHKLVK